MSTAPSQRVSETAPRERRSLFSNYAAGGRGTPGRDPEASVSSPATVAAAPVRREAVEVALARCFLHQFLARAFEYPSSATWAWLSGPGTRAGLRAAAAAVAGDPGTDLGREAAVAAEALLPERYGTFHDDYVAAIGHAARGSSPINEIEYGELKADPLLQPHRLADLAAFYRAFGVEPAEDGGERQDHLSVELEFMAVLCGQEAHALERQVPDEVLALNLEAQRVFLREHLGRWAPTFARRLQAMVADGGLGAVARLLIAFVAEECRRAGVPSRNADVSLRPVDEGAALCDSCGIHTVLPGGALPPAA